MRLQFRKTPKSGSVWVSQDTPLPVAVVSGGSGGPVQSTDIEDSTEVGRAVLTAADAAAARTATGAAAAGHSHSAGDVTSGTFAPARIPSLATSKITGLDTALSDLDRVAAHVAVDGTDLSTLAASVTALRDALITAGLMAPA